MIDACIVTVMLLTSTPGAAHHGSDLRTNTLVERFVDIKDCENFCDLTVLEHKVMSDIMGYKARGWCRTVIINKKSR